MSDTTTGKEFLAFMRDDEFWGEDSFIVSDTMVILRNGVRDDHYDLVQPEDEVVIVNGVVVGLPHVIAERYSIRDAFNDWRRSKVSQRRDVVAVMVSVPRHKLKVFKTHAESIGAHVYSMKG